jgi:hypothetical protein
MPRLLPERGETPKIVNTIDVLKRSMQARGQAKVRDAVSLRSNAKADALFVARN